MTAPQHLSSGLSESKLEVKQKNKPFFGEGNGCEGTQHDSVNDQEPVIGRRGKEVSAL